MTYKLTFKINNQKYRTKIGNCDSLLHAKIKLAKFIEKKFNTTNFEVLKNESPNNIIVFLNVFRK